MSAQGGCLPGGVSAHGDVCPGDDCQGGGLPRRGLVMSGGSAGGEVSARHPP